MSRSGPLVALSLLLAAAACSDPSGLPPPPDHTLVIEGGDGQSGAAGSLLAHPLRVLVRDVDGAPVRGAVVGFRATAPGTELGDTITTSGADGIASMMVRLPPREGVAEIARAFVPRRPETAVAFTATVTAGPSLRSLSRASVRAGDTLTLAGAGFDPAAGGNGVTIGGVRALITRASAGELDVIVPPCLAAGTLPVQVEVGSARTNALGVAYAASTYTAGLAPLEGITIAGAELGSCIRLAGDGAAYLVVPQYATDADPLRRVDFTIGSATATPAPMSAPLAAALDRAMRAGAATPQGRLDLALRDYERRLGPGPSPSAAGSAALPVLGSTRAFRVLCSLEAGQSCFRSVSATLEYVGENVLIYVDTNAPAGGFTTTELQSFGALFDQTLYPIDVATFGTESDIDGNGRVMMLLTPVVNQLTPASACSGGSFVLGFFFGFDLRSASRDSNKGEVFYGLVPDPTGAARCRITKSQVERILPGTFIHEFQHMISYNQHVLVRGGDPEVDWLNEGLSHLAEELAARHYESRCPPPACRTDPADPFPDSASAFMREQLLNAFTYLVAPPIHSVTLFQTGDCCAGRGASWLFLRYLGDRFDSTLYGRLVQTARTGVANVEAATGESFPSLFGDFGIALHADSLPGVPRGSVPLRYRFQSRNLRAIFAAMHTRQPGIFYTAFPLRATTLGAGQAATGTMVPGTSAYYVISTAAGSGPVSLRFSDQRGGAFGPALHAQTGILRIQ